MSGREPTDDDPFTTDGSDDEPTARDAARFLQGEWERASARPPYRLRERHALDRLAEEFGERFVERAAGVRVIAAAVLAALARRLGPGVIYDPGERGWRWRHQGDVPDGEKFVG